MPLNNKEEKIYKKRSKIKRISVKENIRIRKPNNKNLRR
jgi:hypothetical protein